jgi:hypothetical protein
MAVFTDLQKKKNTQNSVVWVRERTVPTEKLPLVGVVPTFADRGCRVDGAVHPYGRNLRFLGRPNNIV